MTLLVEGERQRLQVTEEVVPQVVLDVASRVEDDEARERPHHPLGQGDDDDQAEIAEERARRGVARHRIDALLEQPGHRHLERGGAEQARHTAQVAHAIAPDVAPEAGHPSM